MRCLILILLLPFTAIGQDLIRVKSIIFRYNFGQYNFGDTGRYEKEEITEFLPSSKNNFSSRVFTVTKRYARDRETNENSLSINDTITTNFDRKVDVSFFQNLIGNLNKNDANFNKKTILPFLSKITTKEILSVAKKHDQAFWFIDNENGEVDERGKQYIKQIKQLHLLDSFLIKHKPNLQYERVVMDTWNNLTISFCEQSDTSKYRFEFYELLGQPFSKTVNHDFSKRQRFINLEVNKLLMKILSPNSITGKAVGFDHLKEKFILWCINDKIWDK